MDGRKHVRLLVVNNQEEYCKDFQEYVELNSYCYDIECNYAHDSQQAIQSILKWNPSLVMLDMFLPDMQSQKIIQYCKQESTPIIITSDEQLPDIEKNVLEKGASGYFTVSTDPDNLEQVLNRIVELAKDYSAYNFC